MLLFVVSLRLDRKVKIRNEKNIAVDMKESAIQVMHDALDHIGVYPTTYDSLRAVGEWIDNHMQQKYPRQKWSVLVGYAGGYTLSIHSISVLAVVIDNIKFTLFTKP